MDPGGGVSGSFLIIKVDCCCKFIIALPSVAVRQMITCAEQVMERFLVTETIWQESP